MERLMRFVMSIVGVCCLVGCQKNTVYGSGLLVEDVRTIIGGYTGVEVRNGLKLVIDPSLDKDMVTVKCDEELLSNVSVRVMKGTLKVGYKNNITFQTPLITEVHIPDVSEVSMFDIRNSQMTSEIVIRRDSLVLMTINSDVSFGVQLEKFNLNAEDDSKVRLQGYAEYGNFMLEESSVMERRFSTKVCNATLVRSSLSLGCDELLTATLSEGSRIEYHGNCQTDIIKSGDSEVITQTE
ncbi:MAG: DUF2807 domain-containing protein [Rikenellaceae bacterium]|nr:DUF2807 domain-containing protein [Rikenellaceae bacterium]